MQKTDDTALIFLHLPKTAGSTLNSIINRQYDSKTIYNLYGDLSQQITSTANFKKLSEEDQQKIKLIKGHIFYGFHDLISRPSTYVTLLREPIDRVISLYYYIRRHPAHYHHDLVISKNMSLNDYISSGVSKELNNGQTRQIAGVDANQVEFGKCSIAMLETAKQNISKHFLFVGTTSRFDESLIFLKNHFGWKLPLYQKQNVTKNRPIKSEVSKDTLDLIENFNKLDIELYNNTEAHLEQQIKQQDSFAKELRSFKFVNTILYANCVKIKHKFLSGR